MHVVGVVPYLRAVLNLLVYFLTQVFFDADAGQYNFGIDVRAHDKVESIHGEQRFTFTLVLVVVKLNHRDKVAIKALVDEKLDV